MKKTGIQSCTGRVVSGCVLHCSLAVELDQGSHATPSEASTETPQLKLLLFFFPFFFLGMPLGSWGGGKGGVTRVTLNGPNIHRFRTRVAAP